MCYSIQEGNGAYELEYAEEIKTIIDTRKNNVTK